MDAFLTLAVQFNTCRWEGAGEVSFEMIFDSYLL